MLCVLEEKHYLHSVNEETVMEPAGHKVTQLIGGKEGTNLDP